MGVEKTYQTTTPACKFHKSQSIDIYRPPALRRSIETHDIEASSEIKTNTNINESDASEAQIVNNSRRRERRPDRAVYVPRARRSQTTPPQISNGTIIPPTDCTLSTNLPSPPSTQTVLLDKPNQQYGQSNKIKERTIVTAAAVPNVKIPPIQTTHTSLITATPTPTPTLTIPNPNTTATSVIGQSQIVTQIATVPVATTKTVIDNKITNRNKSSAHQQTNGFLLTKESTLPKTCDIFSNSTNNSMTNCNTNMSGTIVDSAIKKASEPLPLRLIEDASCVNTAAKCDKDIEELRRASKEINRSNRRIIKQTFPSDILEIPDVAVNNNNKINKIKSPQINHFDLHETKSVLIDHDDDWDTMYDDNGECLDPKVLDELTASVGRVRIETPKKNYSAYHIKQTILNDEEFPHVLEVSNFPSEFKTPDLLMVFSPYKESGFVIKWVNDTHALAVFSSSTIAAEVLANGHPFVTLKPLAEACLDSRLKAKKCSGAMQPYRPRPETCVALARRLVSGALGVRLKTTATQRENEKRVLREAKERKLLAAKQRDEVWEN